MSGPAQARDNFQAIHESSAVAWSTGDQAEVAGMSASHMKDVRISARKALGKGCLLYTSDAADDTPCVDL
eukprot:2797727-Amphidinium_carterae.1